MRTAAMQGRVPSWRGGPSTVDSEEVRAALQRALRTGPRSGEVKEATSGHGTVRAKGQRRENVRRRGQGRRTERAASAVSGRGSSCRPSLGRGFHPSRKRPAGWECPSLLFALPASLAVPL